MSHASLLRKNNEVLLDEEHLIVAKGEYNETTILTYLLQRKFIKLLAMGGLVKTDKITGEPFYSNCNSYSDGLYSWCDELAYYVFRHNIELPSDFIQHIMTNTATESPLYDWNEIFSRKLAEGNLETMPSNTTISVTYVDKQRRTTQAQFTLA